MDIAELTKLAQDKDFNAFDQKVKEELSTRVAEKLAEKGYFDGPKPLSESSNVKCIEKAGDKYDWDYDNPKLIEALNKCDKTNGDK